MELVDFPAFGALGLGLGLGLGALADLGVTTRSSVTRSFRGRVPFLFEIGRWSLSVGRRAGALDRLRTELSLLRSPSRQ